MDSRRRAVAVVLVAFVALSQCSAQRGSGVGHRSATSAPPSSASTPNRTRSTTPGADRLGTTSYPVPGDAIVVAPSGADSAPGTQRAPLRTIGAAIARAASGSTIVVRAGVYREALEINGTHLTLQAYPGEAVTIRGARVVTGWTARNGVWEHAGWTPRFARTVPATVQHSHPLANAPDMVFVDGVALRQVATPTQVRGRTFALDDATNRLVLGADPTGHTVEVSFLGVGLHLVDAAGTIVRGLRFDRFATTVISHGAVIDESGGVRFEQDIFTQNASSGLSVVRSAGTTIEHCTFVDNGQLGLHAFDASGLVVRASRLSHNNVEQFDPKMEAGGAKFSSVHDVVLDGVMADANLGNGIWFDVDASALRVVHSDAVRNRANGIQVEISSDVVVASTTVRDNGLVGLRVLESRQVTISNIVAYRNRTNVAIYEGTRTQDLADVVLANSVLMDSRTGTGALLDVQDVQRRRSGAELGITLQSDAFCRTRPGRPPLVAVWPDAHGEVATAHDVQELAAFGDTGAAQVACDGGTATAMFVRPAVGDFRLGPESIARGAAAPMLPPVAAALGLAPGAPGDLGVR